MRDLLVLLTWVALIPAAFVQPYVGVMLWAWTAFISPNAYVYSFMSDIQFNKIVAGVTVLATVLSREKKSIHWDSHLVLLSIFFLHGSASYLMSDSSGAPTIFDKFWKECVLCIFINMLITDRLRLHSLVGISAIAIGFHGVVEGLKVISSGGQHHIRGVQALGDNNQFAMAVLMILPVLYYLSRQSVRKYVKFGWLMALILGCFSVVGTWSRAGFVGLAVLGGALVILSKRRIRSLALVGIVAIAVMSIASAQYFTRISSIEEADADGSFMGRVLAWEVSFQIAREHPLFGLGFHGVEDAKIWAAHVGKVSIPAALGGVVPTAKAAHSIYFEVMGDTGFVGLVLFLSLLGVGFRNVNRAIRYAKSKPDLQWIYDLGVMFRLTLITYAVVGASLSMAYFEFVYVLLTLISVLARLCLELEAQSVDKIVGGQGLNPALGRFDRPMAARQAASEWPA